MLRSTLILLTLTSCVSSNAIDQGADVRRTANEIIIYRDKGGPIGNYLVDVLRERDTGRQIRIEGECTSACTLWLELEDRVCVKPSARLGFHYAHYADGSVSLGGTRLMTDSYPQWLAEWFAKNVKDQSPVYLPRTEMLKHFRSCL